jgi:hypothetical protein
VTPASAGSRDADRRDTVLAAKHNNGADLRCRDQPVRHDFFAEPVAAFTNIARHLRRAGRLCIATWQSLAA